MDGGSGDCPRAASKPAIIIKSTANGARSKRVEARKRSRDEATAFIEVDSPVVVSPARPRVRPRRVRLQVSRVPHARHTVVLFVQSDSYHTPESGLSQWHACFCPYLLRTNMSYYLARGGCPRAVLPAAGRRVGSVLFSACLALLLLPQKRALLQFPKRLAQLFLRIHHDWSVPRHRLLERLAGHQQKPNPFFSRLHHQLIAAVEQHERPVVRLRRRRRCLQPSHRLRRNL